MIDSPADKFWANSPRRLPGILLVVLVFELVAWAAVRTSGGTGADLWLTVIGVTVALVAAVWCSRALVRSRFRFGLKSLFSAMIVLGVASGWLGMFLERTQQQRRIIRHLEQFGMKVNYERDAVPGIETLLGSEYFQNVTHVRLNCQGTLPEDRALLGALRGLRGLELSGQEAIDDDLAHFQGLLKLEALYLDNSSVTGAGFKHLRKLNHLQYIGFRGSTRVDLSGFKELPALKDLNLSGCSVTDADLHHLTDLNQLEFLSLDGTKITDAGMEHLSHLTNLRYLVLTGTVVSDAGLTHLKQCRRLQQIYFGGSRITRDGLRELSKSAPDLYVPDK